MIFNMLEDTSILKKFFNHRTEFIYDDEAKRLVKKINSAMTIKELELICRHLNLADEVCLEKVDLWLAQNAMTSVFTGLKKYSMLRSKINYFGTLNGLIKNRDKLFLKLYGISFLIIDSLRKETDRLTSDCNKIFNSDGIALAFLMSAGKYQFGGIIINEKSLNQQSILADLEYGENIGHSPKGCKTIKSIIDHEMGHLLDFDMQISNSSEYIRFIQNYNIKTIEKNLSSYCVSNGVINHKEVIAEAYAEYCNNPIPRIIAAEIGLIMDQKYKQRYKK